MFDSGYYVTAHLQVKPGRDPAQARAALAELCRRSLGEPGCSMFVLHQDAQDPSSFVLWERFDDEAAFKAHAAEPHTREFGALGLVEMLRAIKSDVVKD